MPRATPSPLFHYCCKHSAGALTGDPVLRPASHLRADNSHITAQQASAWLADVSWLTDLDWITPTMDLSAERILGLAGRTGCSRVEFRATVLDTSAAIWWPTYRRTLTDPAVVKFVADLEASPDARPVHWWILPAPRRITELVPTILRGKDAGYPARNLVSG